MKTEISNGQAILRGVLVLKAGALRSESATKCGDRKEVGIDSGSIFNGLVDTGAQQSGIIESVASKLKLISKTKMTIMGAHGTHPLPVYDVDLVFVDLGLKIENIGILGIDISTEASYQIIIGMDILRAGTLHFGLTKPKGSGICTFCV